METYRTLGELADELNRWLTTRFRHADYTKELPGLTEAATYLEKIFTASVEDGGYYDIIRNKHKYDMEAERRSMDGGDVWAQTHTAVRICGEDNNPSIDIVTLLGMKRGKENFFSIATFPCNMKVFEVPEGETRDASKNAVCSVSCPSADTTIQSILENALTIQETRNLPIWDRWLSLPNNLREKHPICPCCGANVRIGDFGVDGHHVLCDSCNWVSNRKFIYMSDFTNRSAFITERKFVDVKENCRKDLEDAINEANKSVSALYQAATLRINRGSINKSQLRTVNDMLFKLKCIVEQVKKDGCSD